MATSASFRCKTRNWHGICSPRRMASAVSPLKIDSPAAASHCRLRASFEADLLERAENRNSLGGIFAWATRLPCHRSVRTASLRAFTGAPRTQTGWRPVYNLSGGQHGRTYSGYGWFRCKVELPESAKGKELILVLGGYDEQDWNDYWVYLNGQQVGRRTSSGRWRKPGRFTLRPSDSLYASLQFGSSNLLAVRTAPTASTWRTSPKRLLMGTFSGPGCSINLFRLKNRSCPSRTLNYRAGARKCGEAQL